MKRKVLLIVILALGFIVLGPKQTKVSSFSCDQRIRIASAHEDNDTCYAGAGYNPTDIIVVVNDPSQRDDNPFD